MRIQTFAHIFVLQNNCQDALSEWGGKNAVNIIADGEWWRLVTPILLHAGVIHLLCNIAVQLETGAFFEREWGSTNWMIIYLSSAVGSSILSVIAMPNSVSVGSSGAVMGLFGGKLAEVICRACESTKTRQGRIAHSVRKEQLGGTLCAVILVMAFSFIPYGKHHSIGGLVNVYLLYSETHKVLFWYSRLGGPLGRLGIWPLRRVCCFFVFYQNHGMAHHLVRVWYGPYNCKLHIRPCLHVQWRC